MAESPTPVEVLCCYSHADETWLRKLETHLSLLQRQGLISLWHDRLIVPGADWAKAIDTHLETASVILLLVSADFLASDYCYGVELKRALERQEAGEARVVPILVRPVDWESAPFAHLQALPTDAKPLTSWRSKEQALADVAAGIRRVIEDVPLLSASAPRAALPAIWNIPYPRNPFFLGRDADLTHLRSSLQAGQKTALSQPQAISGLGGIGKTQLALEYAYRYHQDYQAVLWARAETREALVSSYVAIAALLRLPEREAREQEVIVQAVKTWLQAHRDWLLVLDNADELALLPDFLPPVPGGHLLLTTRAMATERLAHRLEVETLLPEQGALLLLRRAGLTAPDEELSLASPQERELALQITQELGGLPLALDQAGAYLEATGTDLADYWHMYQQHHTSLLQERRGLIPDHPAPVATTWSLSFQKVEEKNPAATDLLRFCAFLSPDAIPEEVLTERASLLGPTLASVAADPFLFNQVIESLRAYSLVRRDPKTKALSIHRLVQAVMQDALGEVERRLWAERAIDAIQAALPKVDHTHWAQWDRLLPQALVAVKWIAQEPSPSLEAGTLLQQTGSYLLQRARAPEAHLLLQQALFIFDQHQGSSPSQTAETLAGLARIFELQGKDVKAEPLYLRALAICEQQLGPEHPHTATSLHDLASLYIVQGKYEQAEPLLKRALALREQQLGKTHPDTATSLNNLAWLYRDRGQYEQAEPLLKRALAIYEQQLGPNHPHTAQNLDNLASLYHIQGKYEHAEALFLRALAINEQQLGEHPHTATNLNNLAGVYRDQGKYEQAEPLLKRALAIDEQQLGPNHPDTATRLSNLGFLYISQGKHEQAEPLLKRALVIRQQELGPRHPFTQKARTNYTILLRHMDRDVEATRLETKPRRTRAIVRSLLDTFLRLIWSRPQRPLP